MRTIKSKSTLIVFLMMLWSLLAGCAMQSYDDLEDEYSLTGDRTKLDRREALLLDAEEFFLNKSLCLSTDHFTWICTRVYSGGSRMKRKMPTTIDGTIRRYRLERSNGCGCADQEQMRKFMRELQRQMSQ